MTCGSFSAGLDGQVAQATRAAVEQVHRLDDPIVIQAKKLTVMGIQGVHADSPQKHRILTARFPLENRLWH